MMWPNDWRGFPLRKEDLMAKLEVWMVSATLASFWACGSPEQATIDQFFRAAQSKDSTTVAYMSAVSPPGEIASWKVVEVTSRSTEPFKLPEAVDKFKVAEKERNEALAARSKFSKDNKEGLEQVIVKQRDDPEYKFRGKLGEIQEQWAKMLDERKEKERVYQDLKRTVDQESSIASKSVMRKLEVEKLRGNIAVTEMLVNLKPPDASELPFKVTLRKYDLSQPDSDQVESARWIIANIEGASPEAQAYAAAASKASEPAVESASAAADSSKVVRNQSADDKEPSRKESGYLPRELRGPAKVQILAPVTKVEGRDVVTTVRVRNVSKDWITLFTVTEHWYDKQGNAVGVGSGTHQGRFMPGAVIEMEVRTPKSPNFFQDQFEFSHANGEVNATKVGSFPAEN
jgi:hypothetical protein